MAILTVLTSVAVILLSALAFLVITVAGVSIVEKILRDKEKDDG